MDLLLFTCVCKDEEDGFEQECFRFVKPKGQIKKLMTPVCDKKIPLSNVTIRSNIDKARLRNSKYHDT